LLEKKASAAVMALCCR